MLYMYLYMYIYEWVCSQHTHTDTYTHTCITVALFMVNQQQHLLQSTTRNTCKCAYFVCWCFILPFFFISAFSFLQIFSFCTQLFNTHTHKHTHIHTRSWSICFSHFCIMNAAFYFVRNFIFYSFRFVPRFMPETCFCLSQTHTHT